MSASSPSQQRAGGGAKPALVLATRTVGKPPGRGVTYHITDKAPAKGHEDWKRVVAVIVQVRRLVGGGSCSRRLSHAL